MGSYFLGRGAYMVNREESSVEPGLGSAENIHYGDNWTKRRKGNVFVENADRKHTWLFCGFFNKTHLPKGKRSLFWGKNKNSMRKF